MRWTSAGKVTGISFSNLEMTEYATTVTFPDPGKKTYISYMNIVLPGKLSLGDDVRIIITDEPEIEEKGT